MIMDIMPQILVEHIYNECMFHDFHPSEVKSIELIQDMIDSGSYRCYGFYDNEEMLGYAFLDIDEENKVIYLDYLAVLGHCRKKGHGNTILDTIREYFHEEYRYLVAEVEDPEFGENASDIENRNGRIRYYLKNNLRMSNIVSRVVDDHYKIIYMSLAEEPDDAEVQEAISRIYVRVFGREYYDRNIYVSLK